MREAWVVVDLFLGDSGKGATVDFLAGEREAGLVVRFNGGAQAGHNVVSSGLHHTFAQWGAGTFRGVPTALGPDFLLHPMALVFEARHLQEVGIPNPFDLLVVDPDALVISPFQQAAGRLRELARTEPHGTCGVGVGECRGDALSHDDAIRVRDLFHPPRLRRLLARQQERKRIEAPQSNAPRAGVERDFLNAAGAVDHVLSAWTDIARRLTVRPARDAVAAIDRVIFEGAQGILLDETHGLHPHTTWSDCTPAGAFRLLDDRETTVLGVLRSYATRHGAGPLPTHDPMWDSLPEPHNTSDGWQGAFRRGPLDLPLLTYASTVCPVDALAINHMDVAVSEVAVSYDVSLHPGPDLTERVRSATPTLRPVSDLAGVVEEALETPVALVAYGPTAGDRAWRRRPIDS